MPSDPKPRRGRKFAVVELADAFDHFAAIQGMLTISIAAFAEKPIDTDRARAEGD